MPTTELSIEDEKASTAGNRLETRVFTFADGQSRMMSFKKRQGMHLDGLLAEGKWTLPLFLSISYDTAKERVEAGEASDFEDELRKCFAGSMSLAWSLYCDDTSARPANRTPV